MEGKKKVMVCALAVLLGGGGLLSGVRAQAESRPDGPESEVVVAGSLGATAFATDVYHVLCAAGTACE